MSLSPVRRGTRLRLALLFLGPVLVTAPLFAAGGVFNVRNFGAVGDGKTLDTAAINRAIEACNAAGGGQVLLPPGTYLSGTVLLKSNVTLKLDAGARLVGTPDLTQYKFFTAPAGTFEARNPRWHSALVLIDHVENVTITGDGVIDGNKVHDPKGEERMRGPHALVAGSSKNVTIRGVDFKDAANYHMLIEWTDDVDIRDVKATGGWDGVHMRHVKNAIIANTQLYTGDDAIAGRFWENVLITNTVLNSSCNGIRIIGPVKKTIIQNSLIYGPGLHPHRTQDRYNLLAGIYVQPGSWDPTQGDTDDLLISDITMHNPATPFRVQMYKGNKGGRITFNRITATGVYRGGISLASAEFPVDRLVLRDINIEYAKDNPALKAEHRALAAWGLTAKNLKSLLLENVRLSAADEKDSRPAVIVDDVESLTVDRMRLTPSQGEGGTIAMNNVAQPEIREPGAPFVESRCAALSTAGPDGSAIAAGKPYTATATVVNGGIAGLSKAELDAGGRKMVRWVWLRPNENRKVVFDGITAAAGTHELRCGGVRRQVSVR